MTKMEMTKKEKNQPRSVDAELMQSGPRFLPSVDIVEDPERITLLADLPGLTTEDIDIRFENGTLTLYGKVPPRQKEQTSYLLREYEVGDFYRVFEIGEGIDSEKINAEFANGVLTLNLPKVEAAKPRKIEVQGR